MTIAPRADIREEKLLTPSLEGPEGDVENADLVVRVKGDDASTVTILAKPNTLRRSTLQRAHY